MMPTFDFYVSFVYTKVVGQKHTRVKYNLLFNTLSQFLLTLAS